jgi:hypothetical protein
MQTLYQIGLTQPAFGNNRVNYYLDENGSFSDMYTESYSTFYRYLYKSYDQKHVLKFLEEHITFDDPAQARKIYEEIDLNTLLKDGYSSWVLRNFGVQLYLEKLSILDGFIKNAEKIDQKVLFLKEENQ